jgi:hypothetical protein
VTDFLMKSPNFKYCFESASENMESGVSPWASYGGCVVYMDYILM